MRTFANLASCRLARTLLAFLLALPRAVGEEFWQALKTPRERNDCGLMPVAVRLIARFTALAGVIVVPIDVSLLSFPDLTRSPLLERIFTQFFDFLLPASLVGVVGLICALLLLVVAALAAAIGAYKGEFVPGDGVDALRHLIWRVIPSSVAIAISAPALSTLTLFRAVSSVFEAALGALRASMLRMRISGMHARQPVVIRARTITHVCLSPRLLAQRPSVVRALRAAAS